MRAIHLAKLDKTRPVLILTRDGPPRDPRRKVTIAPITSRIRGLSSELLVGPGEGLDYESVISLDNIITIPVPDLGRRVGWFTDEVALTEALRYTFDLMIG